MRLALARRVAFPALILSALTGSLRAEETVVSLEHSVEPLRQAFNAASDRPRLVALLSPTSRAGVEGARALAEMVVGSGADLTVMVVWVDVLHGDNASEAERSAAAFGPRVRQYHDPKGRAAWPFGLATLGRERAGVWNTYVFYRPGSTWQGDPPAPDDWLHAMAGPGRGDPARFRSGAALKAGLRQAAMTICGPVGRGGDRRGVNRVSGEVVSDGEPAPAKARWRPQSRPPASIPPISTVPSSGAGSSVSGADDYNGPFEERNSTPDGTGDESWARPTKSCSKSTAKPTTPERIASSFSPNSTSTTRSARSVEPLLESTSTTDSSRNSARNRPGPSWEKLSNVSTTASPSGRTTSNANYLPLTPLPSDGSAVTRANAEAVARASGPAGTTLRATVFTPVGGKATVTSKSTAPT